MSGNIPLTLIRQLRADCSEALLKSVHGGSKVEPTNHLILPPSDPKNDSWGALFDQVAQWTAGYTKRMDAGETALFATMLKYTFAEYLRTEYPATVVRSWGFFVDQSIPPGAKTVSATRLEVTGRMRLASSISKDAPLTTVQAHEDTWEMAEYIGEVRWSISQLEAAAFAGVPLEMDQLNGLALVAEQNFESVAAIGESVKGIYGLLNEANIPLISAVTGTWSTATAEQVLGDIQKLLYTIRATVKGIGVLRPNILVVPENLWRYLNLRQTYSNETVLVSLKNEFPDLKIEPWTLSETADVAGTGPRLLAGTTSPQASRIFEPLPFQLIAPQQNGVEFEAYARQKLGGVGMHHPKAFGHMDGC